MDPVSFRYTPTEKDYVMVSRRHILRKGLIWALFLSFLMVGVGLKSLSPALVGVSYIWVFVGAALLSVAYVYLIRSLLVVWRVRKNERYRSEATWTLDDVNVVVTTKYGEVNTTWDNFESAEESKYHYFLVLTDYKRAFQMIPKRVFESPEQEKAFRDLLVQHGLIK